MRTLPRNRSPRQPAGRPNAPSAIGRGAGAFAGEADGVDTGQFASTEIVAVLGSIQNSALVRRTLENNTVETIYHAAAYKHVPIVEHNPVAGLRNNTFGTVVQYKGLRPFRN